MVDGLDLKERLQDLYGLEFIGELTPVEGGYICNNFILPTDKGDFFLKQYRRQMSLWVHEIKFSEQFFHEHGLPVILPLKDRFGRGAFWSTENWYSVFPFIEQCKPKFGDISDDTISSLGKMLAKFHKVGSAMSYRPFGALTFWDRDRFYMEYIELRHAIAKLPSNGPFINRIRSILDLKLRYVKENIAAPHHIPLKKDHLLHGDFIYQNVFIGENDAVTHVFDFERSRVGPRSYELARSMFINCFDDGWQQKNLNQAIKFLCAYNSEYPISFEEFRLGIEMYYLDLIHSSSMEAKYLLYGDERHLQIFDSYINRIQKLHDFNLDVFCQGLYDSAVAP